MITFTLDVASLTQNLFSPFQQKRSNERRNASKYFQQENLEPKLQTQSQDQLRMSYVLVSIKSSLKIFYLASTFKEHHIGISGKMP